MALTLQTFAPTGEMGYVAKHNANYTAIANAINALTQSVASGFGAAVSVGQAFHATFGNAPAVIGKDSYKCTGAGSTLTIGAGYAWFPDTGLISALAASQTMSFTGLTAGTYYISAGTSGDPVRSTSATNALYSILWSGSAFTTITRVASLVWAAAEWVAAQNSVALNATFESLDARLEAGETGSAAGTLARTNQSGRLSKTVAGSPVTLTATEANNSLIEFVGLLTANVEVTLPTTGPRCWLASNKTTGNFRLTLKTVSGAGVILPADSQNFVYHNGTDVVSAGLHPAKPAILALPTSITPTADFARGDTVRLTLTADATITLTGAQDGQKCMLEVSQDAVGGWALNFGTEVNLGADIASITISTAPLARDRLGLIYNAASGKYDLVAVMRGY